MTSFCQGAASELSLIEESPAQKECPFLSLCLWKVALVIFSGKPGDKLALPKNRKEVGG